jgi:DNA-nicking Smr family endonuclease
MNNQRECLECGMAVPASEQVCPKCDADLYRQSDGSVMTVDIAHHGQAVSEALAQLDALLEDARSGYEQSVRLIVGGGVINEEVMARLWLYKRDGKVKSFDYEGSNRGAVLVVIRS